MDSWLKMLVNVRWNKPSKANMANPCNVTCGHVDGHWKDRKVNEFRCSVKTVSFSVLSSWWVWFTRTFIACPSSKNPCVVLCCNRYRTGRRTQNDRLRGQTHGRNYRLFQLHFQYYPGFACILSKHFYILSDESNFDANRRAISSTHTWCCSKVLEHILQLYWCIRLEKRIKWPRGASVKQRDTYQL